MGYTVNVWTSLLRSTWKCKKCGPKRAIVLVRGSAVGKFEDKVVAHQGMFHQGFLCIDAMVTIYIICMVVFTDQFHTTGASSAVLWKHDVSPQQVSSGWFGRYFHYCGCTSSCVWVGGWMWVSQTLSGWFEGVCVSDPVCLSCGWVGSCGCG